MHIRLIRHATLIVEYAGQRLLVDPMLDEAGARPAIQNSPNPRKNPLLPLPIAPPEILQGLDAVLVTHTHSDHWDATAATLLSKRLPLFGQPEDESKFGEAGFTDVRPIADKARYQEIDIARTGGQHGTGDIAKMLAPVSGFVLRGGNEPVLYIAGDTVWCAEIADALQRFQPDVIVLNAGGARFLEGDPITMTAEDVITVCNNAPKAQVLAVHMEAINHCLLTRADLSFQLEAARVAGQVSIPQDGEWLDVHA